MRASLAWWLLLRDATRSSKIAAEALTKKEPRALNFEKRKNGRLGRQLTTWWGTR